MKNISLTKTYDSGNNTGGNSHLLVKDEPPIISAKEARKILGVKFSRYSNEEIESLVESLQDFARIFLDYKKSNNA